MMSSKQVIEAEFDRKAPSYETNRLAGWYHAQGEVVLRHIKPIPSVVLDVGCGTGWLLRQIVRENPGVAGIGLDISGRMIEQARAYARSEAMGHLEFVQGDWEDVRVRQVIHERLGGRPATIVCISTLHYFRDAAAAACSMYETLGPEGKLVVLERAMDGSPATRVWNCFHRWFIKDHVRFYRTDELEAMMSDAGFQNIQVADRINRLLWKGKLHTSLAVVTGCRANVNCESAA